jgi:hypothetical protein
MKTIQTLGFKGIEKHGKKYRAVCEANGVMYRSPMFQTAYEVSEEYRKLSKKLHSKYVHQ